MGQLSTTTWAIQDTAAKAQKAHHVQDDTTPASKALAFEGVQMVRHRRQKAHDAADQLGRPLASWPTSAPELLDLAGGGVGVGLGQSLPGPD